MNPFYPRMSRDCGGEDVAVSGNEPFVAFSILNFLCSSVPSASREEFPKPPNSEFRFERRFPCISPSIVPAGCGRTKPCGGWFGRPSYLPDDFIYPLFVVHGRKVRNEINSMPGIAQLSVDLARRGGQRSLTGWASRRFFFSGSPGKRTCGERKATPEPGIVQQAIRAIKEEIPDLVVITDVCLCEYTSHGHCGVVVKGEVDNDATLTLLAKMALSHAEAGADMVAPSDMMDGRVKAIRETPRQNGALKTPPDHGLRRQTRLGFLWPLPRSRRIHPPVRGPQILPDGPGQRPGSHPGSAALDVQEGADIIMVKPALPYLDIIRAVREEFDLPVGAYNVSGEYSMIKAAAQQGWLEEERAMMEVLTAIKRAGADLIITYFAKDAARVLGA